LRDSIQEKTDTGKCADRKKGRERGIKTHEGLAILPVFEKGSIGPAIRLSPLFS